MSLVGAGSHPLVLLLAVQRLAQGYSKSHSFNPCATLKADKTRTPLSSGHLCSVSLSQQEISEEGQGYNLAA